MPMAVDAEFVNHCCELLSGAGAVRSKRMFGGCGLYVDGLFVAIVAGDTLYLKTSDATRARFVDAGSHAFEYTARGERHSTGYFSAPAEAMDSPALMAPWVRLALEAAVGAHATKRPARVRR